MPWTIGMRHTPESLEKRRSTLLPKSQLARLANYIIANKRHGHFDIFHLSGYVLENDTNQRAVTKALNRLEQAGFLMVMGKTKLPTERVHRIVYAVRSPEFGSFGEWIDRPRYEARITKPKPYITVHRLI